MSEKEMTFIEHIIELRNRLKVVAISFVAALIFWMAFPRDVPHLSERAPHDDETPFLPQQPEVGEEEPDLAEEGPHRSLQRLEGLLTRHRVGRPDPDEQVPALPPQSLSTSQTPVWSTSPFSRSAFSLWIE